MTKFQEYDSILIQKHLTKTTELKEVIQRYSCSFKVMYTEIEHRIRMVEDVTGYGLLEEAVAKSVCPGDSDPTEKGVASESAPDRVHAPDIYK